MQLDELRLIFNRAWMLAIERTKWWITFLVLALCGVFVVFCRGLAANAHAWISMSLTFLPIFLCSGILLSLGVVLIRGYHNEVKKRPVHYRDILFNSWETMLGAAYCTIPVILLYLMLWMLLGFFVLLRQIPALGDFFAVVLAFAPFLINLTTLLLCALVIGLLFFVTPIVALKGLNRSLITQALKHRLQRGDLFINLTCLGLAIFPLLIYLSLLMLAAWMTGSICATSEDALHKVLEWFFIMIPFTALLAPAVIFFFNFSAEAHVFMQRYQLKDEL